jgi:pyrimidine operon attenuation protein / uracil phosphoribosyltransferase
MSDSVRDDIEFTVVMDAEAVNAALYRMAQEIGAAHEDMNRVVLLGILRRGRPLAERLSALLDEMRGEAPRVGSLATTLYRDDIRSGRLPAGVTSHETHFDFDVDGTTVILVDDVIAAGRTVRAAMDEVMDYGRPARIQLACLVDRQVRELPIQADYLGWTVATRPEDHVAVRLCELDGEDAVLLRREPAAAEEAG